MAISCEKYTDLFRNDTYINWLDSFSKRHGYFYDDSWEKDCKYLSAIDKENAYKLSLLFNLLYEYLADNNCDLYDNARELFVPLKHKNNYYFIGVDTGDQNTFCKRIHSTDESFVDYDDFKNHFSIKNNNIKKKVMN